MAFFNELGRKLSMSGQNAIQKTRDIADISRLNAAMAEKEKSLTDIYTRIGEAYARIHRKDFEPDFAAEMEAVAREKDGIAEIKAQIMELRGTTLCVSCGSEIMASANFCENCGARQPSAVEMTACVGCGQSIPVESKFCQYCGKPTDVPDGAAPAEDGKTEEIL